MNRIKKFVFCCMLLFWVFTLSGCGKGTQKPSPTAQPAGTVQPTASPSPTQAAETPESTVSAGPSQGLRILFINVGKADSALVTLGGKHYLVDTGSSQSLPKLVKALRCMGVDKLDGIFMSHNHADHIGGLEGLLGLFDVKQIYASKITTNKKDGSNVIDDKAQEAGMMVKRLSRGDEIVLDPADPLGKFSVAGPVEYNADDDNDNSLVMYLTQGPFSCLFTGDMQAAQEKSLLGAGAFKPCTVLKVGNHGNADASSRAFIQAVSPEFAVISTDSSVDKDTPADSVLEELGDVDAKVFLTQDSVTGVLVNVFDGMVSADYYVADAPPPSPGISIELLDNKAELLVLRNSGKEPVDLTHWWILSQRGGELFFFPDQTVIQPKGTLSVASGKDPPKADLTWNDKNIWHDTKADAAIVYDSFGNEACRKE